MILKYKLSEDISKATDPIEINVLSQKKRLYEVMKNFFMQSQNNGVYAENILRVALDGVNLNHLFKNHPHVDIAIKRPIPGVSEKNEIISVKSSIAKNPTLASVLRDTKSIKLESVFSYVVFSSTNFKLDYEKEYFAAKSLYNLGLKLIKTSTPQDDGDSRITGDNKDYKAVLNTTLYYLFFKNKEGEKENFINDIIAISNSTPGTNYKLTYANYNTYRVGVLRRIATLDSPISLGAVYLRNDNNDLTCYIHKTNSIPLSRYWEDIVSIWLQGKNEKSFFDFSSEKYLDYGLVKKLFKIETRDFPIQIRISLGDYQPQGTDYSGKTDQEKVAIRKQQAELKTDKLYAATKLQYADFQGKDKEINDFFLKSIDVLQKQPNLITRFNQFINSVESPVKLERFSYFK